MLAFHLHKLEACTEALVQYCLERIASYAVVFISVHVVEW
jgi:hypothetical protein